MKHAIRNALALLSLLTIHASADLPYIDIASDVQRPDTQFDIKRVFSGNTPMIRWTVTDGYATNAADLSGWTFTLWYGWDNSATSGTSVAQYGRTNNVVRFYTLTNFYAIPNENYYVSIVGTHTAGAVRTWATGKMNQRWDFAANSPSSVPSETQAWNWNLLGPYSGSWPFVAGANVSLTETPTGLVIAATAGNATNGINQVIATTNAAGVASLVTNTLFIGTNVAAGGGVGTITNIASTSALLTVVGGSGPSASIGLSSSVSTSGLYSVTAGANISVSQGSGPIAVISATGLASSASITNFVSKTGDIMTGGLTATVMRATSSFYSPTIRGSSLQMSNSFSQSILRQVVDDEAGVIFDQWRVGTNFLWFAFQPSSNAGLKIGHWYLNEVPTNIFETADIRIAPDGVHGVFNGLFTGTHSGDGNALYNLPVSAIHHTNAHGGAVEVSASTDGATAYWAPLLSTNSFASSATVTWTSSNGVMSAASVGGSVTLGTNLILRIPSHPGSWSRPTEVATNGAIAMAMESFAATTTMFRASLRCSGSVSNQTVTIYAEPFSLSAVASNHGTVRVVYDAGSGTTNVIQFMPHDATNVLLSWTMTTSGVYTASGTNFANNRIIDTIMQSTITGQGGTNYGRAWIPDVYAGEQ